MSKFKFTIGWLNKNCIIFYIKAEVLLTLPLLRRFGSFFQFPKYQTGKETTLICFSNTKICASK